jgi:methyl-accepting chemotaxis protein
VVVEADDRHHGSGQADRGSQRLHQLGRDGNQEMTATVAEIDLNSHEAAQNAGHVSNEVSVANRLVSQLSESSTEIGQILETISRTARQTNLLALNATIEGASRLRVG